MSRTQQVVDKTVHTQWANRPDDERFLTLDALYAATKNRADASRTEVRGMSHLRAVTNQNGTTLQLESPDKLYNFSHWSFGQMAAQVDAPALYLRKLPAPLAMLNVNYGLQAQGKEEVKFYGVPQDGDDTWQLRASTSPTYGRVYDYSVVDAVRKVNDASGGIWKIPYATYERTAPKRATTLYASDRDVFIFLVDDQNPIHVPGEDAMYRGFYAWNSEVGAGVFGARTFLYRVVCDNRMIWDLSDVRELRIRHTVNASERFVHEGVRALKDYAQSSAQQVETSIVQAKKFRLPKFQSEAFEDWFADNGFTAAKAKEVVASAIEEEGKCDNLWDVCMGLTAYARRKTATNERILLEVQAGNLMTKYTKQR